MQLEVCASEGQLTRNGDGRFRVERRGSRKELQLETNHFRRPEEAFTVESDGGKLPLSIPSG
jgi:hypothetical protein